MGTLSLRTSIPTKMGSGLATGGVIDAGALAAHGSSRGFGSMGGFGGGFGGGGGGMSSTPMHGSPSPIVPGEEVRGLSLLGLHGVELRSLAQSRFTRSDVMGTGHGGDTATPYTPMPSSNADGAGGLPYTGIGDSDRRMVGRPIRVRASRAVKDVTDVSAALPRARPARRAVAKPSGI